MTDVAIATPNILSVDRESFESAVVECFDVNELSVAYKAIAMKRTLSKDERNYRKSVIDKKITELEKHNHITKEGSYPSLSTQEIKPKLLESAPIAVILFAGGGGVECGMVAAGIRPVISVELDPEKPELSDRIIEVHEANFSEYGTKVIRKTVQQVAAEGFDGFPRNPDYLHSSNVCKNFSNAKGSKKGETEEDLECAIAVAVAIRELQPKNFTLEQVVGFKDSQSFKLILEALAEEGYTAKWDVVNFADYGVPQSRQRIVLRAGKEALIPLPPTEERVGWHEAIAHLIPSMEDSELLPSQQSAVDAFLKENPLQQPLLIGRTGRSSDTLRTRNQGCFTLTTAIFTDQKLSNRSKFADIVLPGGAVKSLSIESAAKLQSFPGWYQFPEDGAISGTIIGNSVPPLFAFKLFSQAPQEKPQTSEGAIALVCYESEEEKQKYCAPGKWEWCSAIALEEYDAMSLGEKVQWAKGKIEWIESAFPFGKSIAVIGDEDFIKRFDCLDSKKYPRVEIESDSSENQKEDEAEFSEPLATQYLKSSSELTEVEVNEFEEDSPIKVEDGKTYLLVDAIALDEETQSREVISPITIDEYTRDHLDGAVFPAVVVFFDGEAYYLGDGFHRTLALKGAGDDYIHADIRQGTKRDAKLHSCGANSHHGLRRTSADKRKSVITLLKDEEWVQWSNREIARRCGVDEGMVRKYRAELSAGNPQTEVKFERGGKTHTQKIRETFPRQVLISPDHPTKPGKEVTITARLEDGSYLVEGEATQPKYIVEIPKAPKPITSVHQEERAIAQSNGLRATKGALLPECDRNDGIEPEEGFQKILKNQAAINQLSEHMSAITYAQSMQLIDILRLDLLSGKDLKALLSKIDSQLNKISASI